MRGLFSEIQGCFKTTYQGRYLAYLLAELFRQNPKMFSKVLNEFGLGYSHKAFDQINPNGGVSQGRSRPVSPILQSWTQSKIPVCL
jgi:hypothetical protein